MKNLKNTESTGKNGYDIILDTYNAEKFPIIKNDNNALVFPFEMRNDIDYIDTSKFYEDLDLTRNSRGADNALK